MRERGRDGRFINVEREVDGEGKIAREMGGRMGDGGERGRKEIQESDGVEPTAERQVIHS